MHDIYIYIKELRDKMDRLIEEDADNLLSPQVLELSQELDVLIFKSMIMGNKNRVNKD